MPFLRFAVLIGVVFLVGCSSGSSGPVPVEGTVELNKKALDTGTVTFASAEGKTPVAMTITAGKYSGKLAPGKYKVQIESMKEMPNPAHSDKIPGSTATITKSILPARYGVDSKETRDVTAEGPNKFDFSLTSP